MKPQKSLRWMIGLLLVVLFVSACAAPAAAPTVGVPTAVAVAAAPTSPPPTETPTQIPPTNTPVPTDTSVPPTNTPTQIPPTDTPTLAPTNTPKPATPTMTRIRPTLAPSPTPKPAGPKYAMAPVLTAPSNGSGYICWNDLNLSWTWSGPALTGNEWFDIQFTKQDKNEWYSVAWLKETQVTLHPEKSHDQFYRYCGAPFLQYFGTYEWKVRVVSGVQGSGKVDGVLSPDSQIWIFNYG